MNQRKVWRYYCDHCRKGGCGKAAIVVHERHCTRNPARSCRMCGFGGAERVAMLVAKVKEYCSVDELRAAAGECPACMLAACHQARGKKRRYDMEDGSLFYPADAFDFKAEKKSWWDIANENSEQREWP